MVSFDPDPTLDILGYRLNNRKQLFEIDLPGLPDLVFPYALARPRPRRDDPVVKAFFGDEVVDRGIVYVLRSGAWGWVMAADVLAYNRDPGYQRDMVLYALTLRTKKLVEESGLGIREISRRLETSPAQLYRLLDQTNYRKSVDQLIRLLSVIGHDIAIQVRPSRGRPH